MLKVFKYGSFRLKMTSKSNGQSQEGRGRAAGIYGRFLPCYHLIDLCDNLSEEAYAENDNDFDGDVYDNYTAKIFLSAELIPKNKESLDKCLKNFPKKSSGSDIFGVVGYQDWIIIDIKVINGNRFEISNLSVTEYDEYDTGVS
jgi:hypothetical protein